MSNSAGEKGCVANMKYFMSNNTMRIFVVIKTGEIIAVIMWILTTFLVTFFSKEGSEKLETQSFDIFTNSYNFLK